MFVEGKENQVEKKVNIVQTSRGILPTPDICLIDDIVEGRPAWTRIIFCCRWKLINAADNTAVYASRAVLVILVGKLPANYQKMKLKDFLSKFARSLLTFLSGVPASPDTGLASAAPSTRSCRTPYSDWKISVCLASCDEIC